MNIVKVLYKDALIITMEGDLIGENVGPDILEVVNHAIENESKKVIIDLNGIRYMNSSGIGVLITVHSKMKNIGGQVVLVNPNEQIVKILDLTKLSQVFEIVESIEIAKESI